MNLVGVEDFLAISGWVKYSSLALKLVFTGFCVAFSSNKEGVCLSDFSVGKCVGSWLIQKLRDCFTAFRPKFFGN